MKKMHEEKKGVALLYREVLLKAAMMMRIQRSVPVNLWREVVKPREPVEVKPGVDIYLHEDTWSGKCCYRRAYSRTRRHVGYA